MSVPVCKNNRFRLCKIASRFYKICDIYRGLFIKQWMFHTPNVKKSVSHYSSVLLPEIVNPSATRIIALSPETAPVSSFIHDDLRLICMQLVAYWSLASSSFL